MKIVCFGNSITQGWMVDSFRSYPALLQKLCGHRVINAGISGETSADGLARMDRSVLALAPDACIIEFGINDFFNGFSAEQARDNISEIIERSLAQEIRPGLMGFSLPGHGAPGWETIYTELAARYSIPLLPDLFEGLRDTSGALMSDNVHPTEKGYEIIASNCMRTLGRLWS